MSLTGGIIIPPNETFYLVENLVFKEKQIRLDGYHFKNCAFVECALETSTGKFKLEECHLHGNFWLSFRGDAQRAARLASLVDWSAANEEVRVIAHPHEGFSIP